MKVALLADIHGNADALAAVLSSARASGVERLLIAGDLVGYYYEPDRVFEQLAPWTCAMVRGNHEDMLDEWRAGRNRELVLRRYGSGLDRAMQCLNAQQLDALHALPAARELEIGERRVLLCHGSPWDKDFYVYPDAPAEVRGRMFASGHDLVVFGHTHYPVVWRDGKSAAVNPGSVGQPRDGTPGACWALWNTDDNAVELRREAYDTARVVAQCRAHDPDLPRLAARFLN